MAEPAPIMTKCVFLRRSFTAAKLSLVHAMALAASGSMKPPFTQASSRAASAAPDSWFFASLGTSSDIPGAQPPL